MDVDSRLARLEERTGHLQTDVTEIKSHLSRIDAKLDTIRDSIDAKLDSTRNSVDARLDTVKDTVASLAEKVAAFEPKLNGMAASLEAGIIKWMIGTVITATATAFAIAKFVS